MLSPDCFHHIIKCHHSILQYSLAAKGPDDGAVEALERDQWKDESIG